MLAAGALVVSAVMGLSGCSGSATGSSGGGGETLNVLSWESYHDKKQIDKFTAETGIKVNVVNVGSPDEMFAKVKSAPAQWDMALVTSGWYDNYTNTNLLEPIDRSRVDALKDFKLGFDWEAAATSKGSLYGVLYNWGNQPLAWTDNDVLNSPALDKYKNDKGQFDDWNVFWAPALKGQVSIFDDSQAVISMVALTLGIKDPSHLSDQEFEAVKAKLDALRPQIKRLTSGYNDQTDQIARGEVSMAYLNLVVTVGAVEKAGKTLHVNNIIKQGVPAWSDNYSIIKHDTMKLDAIYKFINYTQSIGWQAEFIKRTGSAGILDYQQATSSEAVKAGLTPDALNASLIPATREGETFFSKMVFGKTPENLEKRVQMWNEFKIGTS
jgi:spermidine/putrescine-binding protein